MHETHKKTCLSNSQGSIFKPRMLSAILLSKIASTGRRSQEKAVENTKQNLHETTFQHVPSCHLVFRGQATPISLILRQEMTSALEGLIV